MIKILVILLILILSVLGSKQDSLSDLDKDGVKKSDSLKYPCSAQLSPSTLSDENLQNKDLVNQQSTNEEKKKEKVSITLNCLMKVHEKTATERVPETDTGENGNSRRSPNVQYLMKTKDKYRDFTTNKNRKKANEESTFHIDISEKCTKYEPKLMKKDLNSGRRFNIPDNVQDTENFSSNVSSQRDFYPVSKLDLNPISNQSKIPKEYEQDLSNQKVISSTSTNSGEPNQILSKKVTNNPFTPKYVLSTSLHDEKNPNQGKEVSDKTSTKKYDFTPTDNMTKDLFVLLDFTNKKISDKPSAMKYDLKSIITNKTSEMPIQFHDYNKVSEETSTNKNYEKSYTPIYNNLLLHDDVGNTVASHSVKETDDKSSLKKYYSSSIPKDDINKNPLLLHYVGDKELQDTDYSDKFDLESIPQNNFYEHFQNYSYRKANDKLSHTKKGQTNAINYNINRNLSSYPGLIGKEINNKHNNNNLKFTEILKEYNQELAHDKISDSYASKGSQSNKTPKKVLRTTIDITEPHLVEPTTGYSIKDLFKSRVMLLESTRVCYACSSISDPSCWHPGRSTTVKYCRKGHNACLTKTFKTEESDFIVIRDCGVTCDGTWPVLDDKYKSCSICNEDMCNDHLVDINSGHTNSFNLMYFALITVIIKFVL